MILEDWLSRRKHKRRGRESYPGETTKLSVAFPDSLCFQGVLPRGTSRGKSECRPFTSEPDTDILFSLQTAQALIDQNRDSDIHSILALMVATGHTEELLKILCDRFLHKEAISVVLSSCNDNEALKTVMPRGIVL